MTKTIILPGFSLHNKEWALEVAKHLESLSFDCHVHFWRHWEMGGNLALNDETEQIIKAVGSDKVNFISKSVGTRVTTFLIPKLKNQVAKIIYCGIPLRGFGEATKQKFKEVLSAFPNERVICFQNKKDPFGGYELVSQFIKSINPQVSVLEKPRSDHEYPYFGDFADFLKDSR